MKNKKLKQSLVAFACAFTMMSTGLPVTAAEAAEPEVSSLMSARLIGNCGCTISPADYAAVSRRSCVSNGSGSNGTHTSEYYITYICPNGHGRQSKIEYIKETHVPSSSYKDAKHDKYGFHLYHYNCTGCGDIVRELKLDCMVSEDAEYGHAVP